jgi:hypothetical protein
MGKKRYEMQPSSSTGEAQEDKFNISETFDDVALIASGQRDLPMPAVGVEERVTSAPVVEEPKKKGRPKKGATLDLTVGINVFLDKPLHKKLQYARAETDISIKDLIYMATDYMMNELFDGSMPTKEGERVIREFKEKMFGSED